MDVQAFRSLTVSLELQFLIYLTQRTTGIMMAKPCVDTIEILSNVGVRIERHHKSHVKLALADELDPSNNSEFRLSFDFKTNSPDGVLFYGKTSNPGELIALTLSGGDLMYKIRCPNLHADLLVQTQNNSLLNDSSWHTIAYSIESRPNGREGRIEIDGYNSTIRQYLVSCGTLTTLIMGGHSGEDTGSIYELENLPGHFNGCIRSVLSPTPLRLPPKYYAVSYCHQG